jgi:hypothetical protein
MPNTSRINGFRVVKHLSGAPYNGQANLYYVASAADEILVGDIVKLASTADANGIAGADLCGATDFPVGVVTEIMHTKFDPVGKMTTGSTALDVPAVTQIAASGTGYIMVADDPLVVMEVEAGTGGTALAAADVGMNVKHANGARTSATTTSPAVIDTAVAPATTSTYNFELLGFVQRVGNEIGASAKVLVRFNVHQYNSVGTAGIA